MKAEDYLDDLETIASWAAEKGKTGIDYLANSPLPTAIGSVISNPTPQEVGAQAVNLGKTLYEGVAEEFSKSPEELALNWGPGGIGGFGAMTAYHGTPHKIVGGFKKEAIGTGEGAQAFGHGFYATEAPEIAKEYAEKLSNTRLFINGVEQKTPLTMEQNVAMSHVKTMGYERAKEIAIKKRYSKAIKEEIENFKDKSIEIKPGGRIYTLDIPEPDVMLDWDKSAFYGPNRGKVVDLYKKYWPQHDIEDFIMDSGEDMYKRLSALIGPEKASSELYSLGIKGIIYPAGSISGAKTTARNYVIFEPSDIKITAEEFLDQ